MLALRPLSLPLFACSHTRAHLRAALLARVRVGVLVALPSHVVHVPHIGAQNLPIEARVFELHFAVQVPGQQLRDLM